MRWRSILLAAVVVAVAATGPARAQEGDAEPPVSPSAAAPTTASSVPPGCDLPDPAAAVFVGRLEINDVRTARFAVVQVRAGTLGGFQVDGQVDVDYGDDVRFLEQGEHYLVGVRFDGATGRLTSKVRAPAPMLGGDQVVGIDDVPEGCPELEDPVQTLHLDGSTIETGLLTPLFEDRRGLFGALVLPAVWAFALLVALAALRGVLLGAGTTVARLWRGEPVVQTRPPPRSERPR